MLPWSSVLLCFFVRRCAGSGVDGVPGAEHFTLAPDSKFTDRQKARGTEANRTALCGLHHDTGNLRGAFTNQSTLSTHTPPRTRAVVPPSRTTSFIGQLSVLRGRVHLACSKKAEQEAETRKKKGKAKEKKVSRAGVDPRPTQPSRLRGRRHHQLSHGIMLTTKLELRES